VPIINQSIRDLFLQLQQNTISRRKCILRKGHREVTSVFESNVQSVTIGPNISQFLSNGLLNLKINTMLKMNKIGRILLILPFERSEICQFYF